MKTFAHSAHLRLPVNQRPYLKFRKAASEFFYRSNKVISVLRRKQRTGLDRLLDTAQLLSKCEPEKDYIVQEVTALRSDPEHQLYQPLTQTTLRSLPNLAAHKLSANMPRPVFHLHATDHCGLPATSVPDYTVQSSTSGSYVPTTVPFTRARSTVRTYGTRLNPTLAMPGVKCPKCSKGGIESWVIPGKSCPRCGTRC